MKKISELIIEDGIDLAIERKSRTTVRGIILDGTKVLLIYSEMFNDYTFPGGGKKHDESELDALERELREEIGAHEISVLHPYGFLEELRFGINNSGSVYEQKSLYYICEVLVFGERELIEREIEQGITTKWVEIDHAITHNTSIIGDENHSADGLKTVLLREIAVLQSIKEYINDEKI